MSKYVGHVVADDGEVRVSTSALRVEISVWHGRDDVTPARARELAALLVKGADEVEARLVSGEVKEKRS